MTIQAAIDRLQLEKQNHLPARFHCRAIMVRTIAQYAELLEELKKLGDGVVSIDELFSGADVMPNYERLTSKEYQDKWLILPGVSEYLRLFRASEEQAQRFGTLWHFQSDASTVGRILIPLWGCDALWHDSALGLCSDVRQSEYTFDCCEGSEPQRLSVLVLSGEFEQYMTELETSHGYVSYGLKEWYHFWYEPNLNVQDHLILTKRYRSIKPTDDYIKIHVVRDMLSFIRESLQGGMQLNADICPVEAQKYLFTFALRGASVDDAILAALNQHVFQPLDLMGKWAILSKGQRQLVFLWYALHADDSYLGFCVGQSKNVDDLASHILTEVFPARNGHREWIAESQALIAAVKIDRSDEYLARLDEIASYEERLDYLTDGTARERIYILRMVGKWLRAEQDSLLKDQKLQALYPALAAYLNGGYPDDSLDCYFRRYKMYKLSNTLPADEEAYFSGIQTDSYEYRYPALFDQVSDGSTFVLWIDALGIEWLPLLKWSLETFCEGQLKSVKVTQAKLPSETRFNDMWGQMSLPYEKYDKLDKLAHKGVVDDKDYYACIEEQIRFVTDIASIVNRRLRQYARVLITGDHGTSRLAARYFHKRDALPLPAHAEAGSHGRFCRVQDGQCALMPTQRLVKVRTNEQEESRYIVFSNYDHYVQSGFAAGADDDVPIYGEIHGGASPEEALVPIFTVDSRRNTPLTAKWNMLGNSVKISRRRAVCRLQFSKPVSAVQAAIGELKAECASAVTPAKDWTVTFAGLKIDRTTAFDVSLQADGMLIPIAPVEVKPALGGSDPFENDKDMC